MPFDYKKVEKEYYMPKEIPELVTVPSMNFMAIKGKGNPNIPDGEYKAAVRLLFNLAYGIKMSQKGDSRIEGFYDYVVPPLEGLWWQITLLGDSIMRFTCPFRDGLYLLNRKQ